MAFIAKGYVAIGRGVVPPSAFTLMLIKGGAIRCSAHRLPLFVPAQPAVRPHCRRSEPFDDRR